MWCGMVKEFNCKDTSSWSSCGREREMAFTHRRFGIEGEDRTTWDSWDHYPIHAMKYRKMMLKITSQRGEKEEMERIFFYLKENSTIVNTRVIT